MEEDCWHILGLEAATATERDVKGAYARLLKQHRPDTDPEGFQRVRAAYQAALAALAGGNKELLESSCLITGASDLTWAALRRAADSHDVDVWIGGAEIFGLPKMESWSIEILATQYEHVLESDALRWLVDAVSAHEAFAWWKEGATRRCLIVFASWEHSMATDRMLEFVDAIIADKERPADKDAALLVVNLARWVAFWSEEKTNALCDAAYATLPQATRDILMDRLDEEIGFAHGFLVMRSEARAVWWAQLRVPRRKWDWDSQQSRSAITAMAEGIDQWADAIVDWEERIPEKASAALWEGIELSRGGSSPGIVSGNWFFFRSYGHFLLLCALFMGMVALLVWLQHAIGELFSNRKKRHVNAVPSAVERRGGAQMGFSSFDKFRGDSIPRFSHDIQITPPR